MANLSDALGALTGTNLITGFNGLVGKGLNGFTDALSGGQRKDQIQAQQEALAALQNVETPDPEAMKVQLQEMISQGLITPEQAQAALIQSSAYDQVRLDPGTRQAQIAALSQLQDISDDGFTAQQAADLGRIKSNAATESRGAQQAILQNAQERGVGGGGLEMLSRMQAQQAQAGQRNLADLNVAAQADQNKLAALQQIGTLGGNIRGQDYSQEAAKAQAANNIAQFNAGQMQRTNEINTAAKNTAQGQNLAEKQRIADANTALRNQQQAQNKAVLQQDFENRYRKAGGVAGGQQNLANAYGQQGQQNTQVVGSGVQAFGMAASDERLKKDVGDFDAGSFLDSLTAKSYRYKEPKKFGEGKVAGVMAQDLEKTPEGAALVEETPDGKMVDYGKGFGTLLGSMADMHKRLKKVEGNRNG